MTITGRELNEKLNYLGMERSIRKLAIKDHPERLEEIATMSMTEVCDLVCEDYELVYEESDSVGLVKKENAIQLFSLIEFIER